MASFRLHLLPSKNIFFKDLRNMLRNKDIKQTEAPAMTQAPSRKLYAEKSANLSTSKVQKELLAILFERTEFMFLGSNCTEDCKVKFATGTLTEEALSWWNSFAQPIGIEEAYKITWVEFKKLLIKKYYPRTEVQKMEDEFYHLTVKGMISRHMDKIPGMQPMFPRWCQMLRKMDEVFIRDCLEVLKGIYQPPLNLKIKRKPLT
ncbi:reverse transcriptase domain-containing protein [Tanacetum coccineum]|uniref:Reverse transcriptase domain-containing protein n=1 Tax=Tanacetum coccineum TaxID=301880 RepID=A0ABQ5BZQ9_9ASTR